MEKRRGMVVAISALIWFILVMTVIGCKSTDMNDLDKDEQELFDAGYRQGREAARREAVEMMNRQREAEQRAKAQADEAARLESEKAAEAAQRRIKPKPGDLDMMDDDSDYADSVVRLGKNLVFTTCKCGLPEMYVESSAPLLLCRTTKGNHEVYVQGSRDLRKKLAQANRGEGGHLIVAGRIVSMITTTSTSRYTGQKSIEGKAPVIEVKDVEAMSGSCF